MEKQETFSQLPIDPIFLAQFQLSDLFNPTERIKFFTLSGIWPN
jgi:hypothetical protein